jgi:hypothetical protein
MSPHYFAFGAGAVKSRVGRSGNFGAFLSNDRRRLRPTLCTVANGGGAFGARWPVSWQAAIPTLQTPPLVFACRRGHVRLRGGRRSSCSASSKGRPTPMWPLVVISCLPLAPALSAMTVHPLLDVWERVQDRRGPETRAATAFESRRSAASSSLPVNS